MEKLIIPWILIAISICYFELAVRIEKDVPLKKQSKKILGNSRYNLYLYEAFAILSIVLLVYYSVGYLMSISNVLLWILIAEFPIVLTIYFLKRERSTHNTTNISSHYEDYFQSIAEMSPREGLKYIVEYITNPSNKCPTEHHEGFLEYLSLRNDEYGELAKRELQNTENE